MDLHQMLVFAAERNPEKVAVADASEKMTYSTWLQRASRLANALAMRGIGRGDRVALGMCNREELATTFFATQLLGAVAVPFNFRSKAEGAAYIIEQTESSAVFVDDSFDVSDLRKSCSASTELLWVSTADSPDADRFADFLSTGPVDVPSGPSDADDLSTILFTSGTTGRPKGVPVSHRETHARVLSWLMNVGPLFDQPLRTIGAAPMYHTVGLHWSLCLTIFLNGTYVPTGTAGPEQIRQMITEHEITYLLGSPTLLHMLLGDDETPDPVFPSIDQLCFGSAPMPEALLARLVTAFPNATVNEIYGTTELSIPFATRDVTRWGPGALRPTADQRMRIVRPWGEPDEVVPAGQTGELIIDMKNDSVFSGYWRNPEQTASKVKSGWFYTGDAFHRDADGNFYITGRLDDMFISGAENIQPAEVEQTLLLLDGVEDAAVLGTPDSKWGQTVTALVVRSNEGVTAEKLDQHCRSSKLDDYKRPRIYRFVESIPRNPSGKIVRAEINQLWSSLEAARTSPQKTEEPVR